AEEAGIELPEHGNFFQPTILTDIPEGAKCRYTEFFGPVSQIYRVKDEEEAITLANDSPYGLGGSVFTEDLERGKKVAARL
ncbi:aldehyde dehydrogenase family protein, partial [Streptococcus anginosus]|nr:aldehyde dehydrogenase family protein [Streptococcus anginosus]